MCAGVCVYIYIYIYIYIYQTLNTLNFKLCCVEALNKTTTFPTGLCGRLAVLCQERINSGVQRVLVTQRKWLPCGVSVCGLCSGPLESKMLARLMVAVRGSGLGVRASGDGLLRVAGAGCPGVRQQRQASTAEVSGARGRGWTGGQREVLSVSSSIKPLCFVQDELCCLFVPCKNAFFNCICQLVRCWLDVIPFINSSC